MLLVLYHGLLALYHSSGVNVAAILLSGAGVAYSGRIVKHIFGVESRKVMSVLVAVMSFAGPACFALASYVTTRQMSGTVVPHATEILSVATLVYNLVAKGGRLDSFLNKVKEYQDQQTVAPATVSLAIPNDAFTETVSPTPGVTEAVPSVFEG